MKAASIALSLGLVSQSFGLMTLVAINEIANMTREFTKEIGGLSLGANSVVKGVTPTMREERVAQVNGGDDEDELEDVVAAALKMIDAELLKHLNVPMPREIPPAPPESQKSLDLDPMSVEDIDCPTIIDDHHAFLEATTFFLRAIEFRQAEFQWDGESPVFNALGYMQALWASRQANRQHRSFIEQQLMMYRKTECFGDQINEQVLRRDIELVEYMNNLLDTFYGQFSVSDGLDGSNMVEEAKQLMYNMEL